jgi:putative multiple sugar transport system substrate-binding protein
MSRGRRHLGVGLSLSLAAILVMTVVGPVGAATVGASWQAKIGSAGANGTATILAYTTGSGSLALKLARLRAATSLPVTLWTGACGSVGSPLITLPAIRTTSSGTAARTSSLTVTQVRKLKGAAYGGKVAIRIGSRTTGGVKCGLFTLTYAPIGFVLPSGWPDLAAFRSALASAPYGARLLVSSDVATEKAAVETLVRQGIRVLLLCTQDSAAAAAAANEASAAGVKVIAYGRLIRDTASVDFHLDFDNPAVGAAMGQYLVERAGTTKGNNLYLYAGNAADDNTFLFFEGAWEKLQPKIADGTFVIRNSSVATGLQGSPTLTHDQQAAIIGQVTTNWDPNVARILASGNLAAATVADKGTVFVLAPNDATARAISDVFAADPAVTKSWLTGQDAEKASVQYIIDGRQSMTVFKDPRQRVQAGMAAAGTFLAGGTPAATTTINNGIIDVPSKGVAASVTVTRDNLQAVLFDSGYYRASDFTGSWPGKP